MNYLICPVPSNTSAQMIWLNSLMSCPFRLLSQNVTDWVAYQQHNLFLTVLGVWHPRLRCLQIWCLGRPDFWFWDTCLLAVSSWGGKNGELSRISCMRARVPFLRTPPSWLNHLPKASTSNTITLGLGFRVWIWWGGGNTNLQSMRKLETDFSFSLWFSYYLSPLLIPSLISVTTG